MEDEKSLREALGVIFRLKNFTPLETGNGKEGVELALSKHPNIILLDLIMPEMDGMTALKKIRQDSWGANVPVVILTNVNALSEQAADVLTTYKPIDYLIKSDCKIYDVIDKVENILEIQDTLLNKV